jgi:hypothetical protein
MPAQPSTSQTFILRVWLEPGPGGEAGEWRGELKSVPGGETVYFRGLDGVGVALRRAVEGDGGGAGNRE